MILTWILFKPPIAFCLKVLYAMYHEYLWLMDPNLADVIMFLHSFCALFCLIFSELFWRLNDEFLIVIAMPCFIPYCVGDTVILESTMDTYCELSIKMHLGVFHTKKQGSEPEEAQQVSNPWNTWTKAVLSVPRLTKSLKATFSLRNPWVIDVWRSQENRKELSNTTWQIYIPLTSAFGHCSFLQSSFPSSLFLLILWICNNSLQSSFQNEEFLLGYCSHKSWFIPFTTCLILLQAFRVLQLF